MDAFGKVGQAGELGVRWGKATAFPLYRGIQGQLKRGEVMKSPGYVWEKMFVAVGCLCGEGSFTKRLEGATISALIRLNADDVDAEDELAEDFQYILHWTNDNIADGKLVREPDERERSQLVDKMLHVMHEAHERNLRQGSVR